MLLQIQNCCNSNQTIPDPDDRSIAPCDTASCPPTSFALPFCRLLPSCFHHGQAGNRAPNNHLVRIYFSRFFLCRIISRPWRVPVQKKKIKTESTAAAAATTLFRHSYAAVDNGAQDSRRSRARFIELACLFFHIVTLPPNCPKRENEKKIQNSRAHGKGYRRKSASSNPPKARETPFFVFFAPR